MNQLEWLGALASGALWYGRYEFSGRSDVGAVARSGRVEALASVASYASIPPITFGLVWFLIYGANSAATYLYWRNGASSGLYGAVWALLVANVFVNKLWTAIFADARRYGLAAFNLLANLLLAVALLILLAIDASDAAVPVDWAPFVLFLPYALWLAVALYLNCKFSSAYNKIGASLAKRTRRQGQM